MNKENRDTVLKVRLTPTEKQKIEDYAEKYNMTMSEVVRELCYKIFNQEE